MDRIDKWLDDETVKALKSVSKKLMPSEDMSLTREETLAVMKITEHKHIPKHVIQHFLAKAQTPDI